MTAEPPTDPNATKAADEAAQKEAYQYWGYLIKEDKCGTETLDRLLRGLADVVVSTSLDSLRGPLAPYLFACILMQLF